MKQFNVSIHDITKSYRKNIIKLISLLEEIGINKVSLLLVPIYHKKESLIEIEDFIKELSKDKEIILHGLYHKAKGKKSLTLKNRIFTKGEGRCQIYPVKSLNGN